MPFFISKRALVAAPVFEGRSNHAPALFFMHGRSYMSISAEEKVCYLREAAIVLAKEGFLVAVPHWLLPRTWLE